MDIIEIGDLARRLSADLGWWVDISLYDNWLLDMPAIRIYERFDGLGKGIMTTRISDNLLEQMASDESTYKFMLIWFYYDYVMGMLRSIGIQGVHISEEVL